MEFNCINPITRVINSTAGKNPLKPTILEYILVIVNLFVFIIDINGTKISRGKI